MFAVHFWLQLFNYKTLFQAKIENEIFAGAKRKKKLLEELGDGVFTLAFLNLRSCELEYFDGV